MDEELIDRREIVGLIWSVNDMAESLRNIEQLLKEDDGEEEADS
jgi:hypothetical protein